MNRIFLTQITLGLGALTIPAVCWLLVALNVLEPRLASDIALPGLIGVWVSMLALPLLWRYPNRKMALTAFVLVWGFIGSVFPIIWDLTWAILHSVVNGAGPDDHWLWYWWAYANADTRFLRSDHLMIIVEYWSGILGFVELYALAMFAKGRTVRAFAISVPVAFMQFYGCTVFFGTEAMAGFPDITPDLLSRIKVFGLNGMWLFFPLASLVACWSLTRNRVDTWVVLQRDLLGRDVDDREDTQLPTPATVG